MVNHDGGGGTALGAVVWSAGSLPKKRRIIQAVRGLAMLHGPNHIGGSQWVGVHPGGISGAGVAPWPFSVSWLVHIVASLSTLHWPAGAGDVGGTND